MTKLNYGNKIKGLQIFGLCRNHDRKQRNDKLPIQFLLSIEIDTTINSD